MLTNQNSSFFIKEERPRERWVRHGGHALSLSELIAIVLGTGCAEVNAHELAHRILHKAESFERLFEWTLEQWTTVQGVGTAKAMRLMAAFEIGKRLFQLQNTRPDRKIASPKDVFDLVAPSLRFENKEHFICLFLNTKNRVLAIETLSIGTLDSTLVHPREVFKAAIQRSAAAVICAHNHPSGDPVPSKEDVQMTRRLLDAGNLIGIELLDHIIVGADRFTSMKELGMLK